MKTEIDFSMLVGRTFATIEGLEKESDEVLFTTTDGSIYKLWHESNCCESVRIVDVIGDVQDLIDSPVILADEATNGNKDEAYSGQDESFTWTFYRLTTGKGHVDIRWLGESNGCYSEGVSFTRVKASRGELAYEELTKDHETL